MLYDIQRKQTKQICIFTSGILDLILRIFLHYIADIWYFSYAEKSASAL